MRRPWVSTHFDFAEIGVAHMVPMIFCLNMLFHAYLWKLLTLGMVHGPSEDFAALGLTHGALALLGLAYVVWVYLLVRGFVSVASGSGLALAGYGLTFRCVADLWTSLSCQVQANLGPENELERTSVLGLTVGLAAYVVGLALCVAACVADWRVRRIVPLHRVGLE